ncbi:NADPH2:quinone reductase [Lutimaribacter pacificus]|uniref:NADPH2:quinone reductase n=1 Tax=Lutimaribacter pacificus TaxID=391948 RepID=A0A1H0M3C2_9RHOB|nr:zinc-binding dehydrogenase [Lutimaribacter pacificus]SDO74949.1 NADPH2:quinone reductase [Lutimaribacter pacificus]SHK77317.1 NADPH2:quinone reductase [Lutimaribacter pacificus]
MDRAAPLRTRRLLSRISDDGELHAWIEHCDVPPPGPGEITVRLEARPIHSSDMNVMFGPADFSRAMKSGTADAPEIRVPLRAGAMAGQKLRVGQLIEPGMEGAGTVLDTGEGAEHLAGNRVAVWGKSTYRDIQVFSASSCLELPDDVTLEDGAAAFVNPLTALGLLETAKAEGHKALINTAAASNIGHMLIRLCHEDGLALVSVVRRPELAAELRALGADHVVDTSADDADAQLVDAIGATGARLCFDAVGGKLTGRILECIETSARASMTQFSNYGSQDPRQCYIYGALDPSPIEIPRTAGLFWSCQGWLLFPYLETLGPEKTAELLARVRRGLGTTFRGQFSNRIELTDVLRLDAINTFFARGTGSKTLITG